MRRDVRIGMFIGLALAVAGAAAMLATKDRWQSLSGRTAVTVQEDNEDSRFRNDSEPAVSFSTQAASTEQASTIPATEQPAGLVPLKTIRFHIVQQGETLSSIAKQYYGTTSAVAKILEANRQALSNPDKIRPGTKIIIPE